MAYSSIIEIIGVKELAEDDASKFLKLTQTFRETIETTINRLVTKYSENEMIDFNAFIFRDHCYIQFDKLEYLISFIQQLRIYFFFKELFFFRAIITDGELNIKSLKKTKREEKNGFDIYKNITHFEFGVTPTRLYGVMEKFKGVGIYIDEEKIKKHPDWENLQEKFFINYFISDTNNKKFQPFIDCKIGEDKDLFDQLVGIFNKIYGDKLISKKLGRFYIPLIINIARHFPLSNSNQSSIDKYLNKPLLNKVKDVTGIELFYYTLIDRFFDPELEKITHDEIEREQIANIQKEISKNNWLIDMLRNDNKISEIPKEILSPSKKRIALRKVAELQREQE